MPDFWRVTMIDPGPAKMFDTVYTRGPMALQALNNVMGDRAFDGLVRAGPRAAARAAWRTSWSWRRPGPALI